MKPTTSSSKPRDRCIDLHENQVVTIQAGPGTSILCVHGQVWITQVGDSRDYIVSHGLRYVAPAPGKIVINGAAGHSRIEVGYASARRGIRAHAPLQIDWQSFTQIESAARHARSVFIASAFDALATQIKRARHRIVQRLTDLIHIVVRHKPKGNT